MVDWNKINETDKVIIHKIAMRATKHIQDVKMFHIDMDVSACHICNPLKLQELLDADDFNFVHDVGGIVQNINRETGKLDNCFLPRFTKPNKKDKILLDREK